MKRNYCAFIHEEKGKFGISFSDFPGCISVGDTLEEACENGKEALEAHIELMIEDNEEVPAAKDIKEIIREAKEDKYNPQLMWLTIEVPDRKVQRVNITIPEYALNKIDAYIASHKNLKNRSSFLVEAATSYIQKHA